MTNTNLVNSAHALDTVSVTFIANNSIQSVVSFSESESGNKAAQDIFIQKIKQLFPTISETEDMDVFLDNGYFESDNGDVLIFLTHSSSKTEFLEA